MIAAEYIGHVVGGWEYVYASYALTYGGMAAYAVSLWLQRGNQHDEKDGSDGTAR